MFFATLLVFALAMFLLAAGLALRGESAGAGCGGDCACGEPCANRRRR